MKYDDASLRARLEARVKGVNRCRSEALKVWDILVPMFKPLVGCKILKADGSLLKSIKTQLPEFPNTHALFIHQNSAQYSLSWSVKTAEQADDTAIYSEVSVYIGEMDGDVLKGISQRPIFRTDYTADEVHANRQAYKLADEARDRAEGKLSFFGERDT